MNNNINIKARAKINLALDILSKRDDGYHNVKMIMQSINLYDKLNIRINNIINNIKININRNIECEDKDNLAYIAAKRFLKKANINKIGMNIKIEKNIPIKSGLAGGSTDAAAVLYGLNALFDNLLTTEDLLDIGASIGADVPFCLLGGTYLAEGTGTILKKLNNIPKCYLLVVKPDIDISTKQAYILSDKYNIAPNKEKFNNLVQGIDNSNIKIISNNIFNKFQDIIGLKEINNIIDIMIKGGALNACMTGSGSAVYGIFENKEIANKCKSKFNSKNEIFLTEASNESINII